jgi:hypothetical protein
MELYGIEERRLAVNLLPYMTKKMTHNPHGEMKTLVLYLIDFLIIKYVKLKVAILIRKLFTITLLI